MDAVDLMPIADGLAQHWDAVGLLVTGAVEAAGADVMRSARALLAGWTRAQRPTGAELAPILRMLVEERRVTMSALAALAERVAEDASVTNQHLQVGTTGDDASFTILRDVKADSFHIGRSGK